MIALRIRFREMDHFDGGINIEKRIPLKNFARQVFRQGIEIVIDGILEYPLGAEKPG